MTELRLYTHADCLKHDTGPDHAEPLIDQVVAELQALGATVATGRFRADMAVELVNDGPVTLLVEVGRAPV